MTTAKTIYPSYGDYNLSVAHLPTFAREPRVARAQPQKIANGNLVAYSGGYSRVYPVQSGSGKYALRCWTADVGDARERYRQIGAYLAGQAMPYFVEFEYLENALVVKGQHYPVLWMEWAEGPRLREFIGQNLRNRPVLRQLAEAFREMVAALHAAQISHGDLQDENIIVQNGPSGPRLRLIDYDSLFVPALRGYSDQIIGVSHYQHPRRDSLRAASERVDYFSELVIYLSLLAYEQNPTLWKPQAEKQLLFADTDFVDPVRSPAFQTLGYMTGEVAELTQRLIRYCRETDLLRLEPLEAVTAGMNGGSAPRTSTPATGAGTGGGLPRGFLETPTPTSAPAGVRIAVPDDLLVTPPGPGRSPGATPVVHVPGDLLVTPPAPAQPPRPAPSTVPDDFLNGPTAAMATSTRASTGIRPDSRGWEAFFEGAARTARAQPGTTVLTAPRPAPPMPPPVRTPPSVVSRRPVGRRVDWKTVGLSFIIGVLLVLLILAVLLVLRSEGVLVLGAAGPGTPAHGAPAALPGPAAAATA